MDKSQVFGAIICLVLAAFFEILALVLPAEKVWFTFSLAGLNVSIVSIILALVGLVLLFTLKPKKQIR
jgi:hypothetical protein